MSDERILYFGSRTWVDLRLDWTPAQVARFMRDRLRVPWNGPLYSAVFDRVRRDLDEYGKFTLIEGEADGADLAARVAADFWRIRVDPYPVSAADWKRLGKRAGPLRNERMVTRGRPTRARGFVSGDVGEAPSRGSANMLSLLRRFAIPTIVYRENGSQDLEAMPELKEAEGGH